MEELIKKQLTDDEHNTIDMNNMSCIIEFLDEFYEEKGSLAESK